MPSTSTSTKARTNASTITIDDLRRFAVARSLFAPTTLKRALRTFGFVQADPIRAPARAQDLTLRHRVKGYRAGDLERHYATLDIAEDFFINYGFLTCDVQALMHPRGGLPLRSASRKKRMEELLAFVRERGTVHPRAVDEHFAHGRVTNYWGGSSNATTHLLDNMHYRGLLRVARREGGIRLYAVHEHAAVPIDLAARRARIDALVDVVVGIYAPMPAATLRWLVARLRYGVPQWRREIKPALQRAMQRLAHARVADVDWYWPAAERVDARGVASSAAAGTRAPRARALVATRRAAASRDREADDTVRLLAPFDPIVWDRRRFEILFGWAYRFEAYTPAAKRKFGYYALPLLWRDRVIGWGNLSVTEGALDAEIGYVGSAPTGDPVFVRELDAELSRMRQFLGLESSRAAR
jgi:uncharacterized protein YcaQ